LVFKDNGIGIDLEMHAGKMFGMYKTFHGNADAKGLGLFIIKTQIEALDGKIEVESELGHSTTFKVDFKATSGA
jgi:signal transduction histidine kinase